MLNSLVKFESYLNVGMYFSGPPRCLMVHWEYYGSWDSSVGIATDYGLDGQERDFSLLHSVEIGSGAHPAS
jgi:hypothetical protein